LLVNGTHTTLAFMTLCLRQPRLSPNEVRGDGSIDFESEKAGG
jgi:hypothetical protein